MEQHTALRCSHSDADLREEEIEAGHDGVVVKVLSDIRGSWGGTCGAALWAASTVALPWLAATEDRQRMYMGRSVIELGAGLGLLGIGLSKLGASRVMLTDLPAQMPLLTRNLRENSVSPDHGRLQARILEWGTCPEELALQGWDLIVGADLVYDEDLMPALALTLARLLHRNPEARAVLVLPDRSEFDSTQGDRPDYCVLFDLLALPEHGALQAHQVGAISSEEAGTLSSNMHIFVVSHSPGAPAAAARDDMTYVDSPHGQRPPTPEIRE